MPKIRRIQHTQSFTLCFFFLAMRACTDLVLVCGKNISALACRFTPEYWAPGHNCAQNRGTGSISEGYSLHVETSATWTSTAWTATRRRLLLQTIIQVIVFFHKTVIVHVCHVCSYLYFLCFASSFYNDFRWKHHRRSVASLCGRCLSLQSWLGIEHKPFIRFGARGP